MQNKLLAERSDSKAGDVDDGGTGSTDIADIAEEAASADLRTQIRAVRACRYVCIVWISLPPMQSVIPWW